MKKRALILCFASLLVSSLPLVQAQSKRPNIIFIQTDDQAAWALGVSGNRDSRTPNLDRFFREGAYLRNAFVSTPVCSPSRASLITSRYGTELGVTDWINPNIEPDIGLSPEIATWPKLLADAGYFNGLIGKWHLGTQDRFHPSKFGFKYFMGFRAGGVATKIPANTVVRGRDITPLFRGKNLSWDDDLYVEWSQHYYVKTHLRMYRTPQWKLVRDFLNPGNDELYNLGVDPDENRNLINDPSTREIRRRLESKLIERMRTNNDSAMGLRETR
ncbi:MAG: sulfatase-like hydrolase/transferase [Acidobacteria bacterium]|nr:sulfatase-like hydrolase/transferase [Acidobacteriota bacterium]